MSCPWDLPLVIDRVQSYWSVAVHGFPHCSKMGLSSLRSFWVQAEAELSRPCTLVSLVKLYLLTAGLGATHHPAPALGPGESYS